MSYAQEKPANGHGSLRSFLNPRSIALFGASDDPKHLRGRITRLITEKGFSGDLYLINPNRREIGGRRCYASINEVGIGVDLAAFVVPADQVLPALEDCARLGVRNALILSSGFADGGGNQSEAQDSIAALARRSGMRICGPNTVGFYQETGGVAVTFSPAIELKPEETFSASARRVGVIAQSGGLGFSLYHRGRHLGLNFSTVVTTGNEVDLTAGDFLSYMAEDEDTHAILMFLETVRDGEAFIRALQKAAAARKPIVVVKVGRSAAASRATISHTGSLAGWDAAYDAVFVRYGVTIAEDLGRAVAIAAGFVTNPLPRGKSAAIVTVSGGAGALAADRLSAGGFAIPELSESLQTQILEFLPTFASATNPVDVTGQATQTAAPLKSIEALNDSSEVDLVVMASTMSRAIPPINIEGLRAILAKEHKPLFFYTYTLPSEFGIRALAEAGMVTYTGLEDIVATASAMAQYQDFLDRQQTCVPRAVPKPERIDRPPGVIAEHEAKDFLAAKGIAIGDRRLLHNAKDIAALPTGMFPVAVKIQSRDIPHKTEARGVRLNVGDAAALTEAYREILEAGRSYKPDAVIDGVLVEPMAPRGIEIIVGVVRDPTFGPILAVGAGGVTAELINDVVRLQGYVDEATALSLIRGLRTYALLNGYRGAPRADVQALARLVSQISAVAADHAEDIAEIELNPVLVHPQRSGVTVVDALIVIESNDMSPSRGIET
jgi:acyl-CoA synthetase (NDP forming)